MAFQKSVIRRIIKNDLKKRKICGRFAPRALTTEHEDGDVFLTRKILLKWSNTHTQNCLKTIITSDKNWCLADIPKTKRQNAQWVGEN